MGPNWEEWTTEGHKGELSKVDHIHVCVRERKCHSEKLSILTYANKNYYWHLKGTSF